MKQKAEHCVFTDNVLKCLHCAGTFTLPLPMDIKDMGAKVKAFISLHGDCKKQPVFSGAICAKCKINRLEQPCHTPGACGFVGVAQGELT